MNIAYCIIAHRNTSVLETTIEILSEDNDIYLHVDKKSDINEFEKYNDVVTFIKNRINIHWGEYSQIECMVEILKNCANQNYDYICILSGDDLPIKNSEEIKKFFSNNKGKEFIGIQKEFNKVDLINRVRFIHDKKCYKKNKTIAEKIIMEIRNRLKLFKPNEYYKLLPKLFKGNNWFCITNELAIYILNYLDENKWYTKAFDKSLCGDEVFFQTIVMNSKFKNNIYNYDIESNDNYMSLRYVDWKTGPQLPKILDESDFDAIKSKENKNLIFARKFDTQLDIDKYKEKFGL